MKTRYKLDPTKSAIENLWDCARVAAVVLLRKYHIRSYIDDKYIDLFNELVMQTVVSFMFLKVRQHEYDRRHSFFENVYSCCWGCDTAKKYFRNEERSRELVSMSLEDSEGGALESTLKSTAKHSLDIDNSCQKVRPPKKQCNNAVLYHAEEDLMKLWELDDLEAEGPVDKVEIGNHREAILRRVREITSNPEFIKKKKTQEYNTMWRRLHGRKK